MSEENAIRVIEDQPEAAAIEIPHEAGHDPYQVARELVVIVREAKIADAKLRDQALRAATSACLNIAEAGGHLHENDKRERATRTSNEQRERATRTRTVFV